jgi:signal recognition particle subunit SRP54
MIREGLREIRRVLLEADVNYQVTREFLKRVEEKALGERVLKAVSPGQQIVKIVHEELTAMLGEKRRAGDRADPAHRDHDGRAAGLG